MHLVYYFYIAKLLPFQIPSNQKPLIHPEARSYDAECGPKGGDTTPGTSTKAETRRTRQWFLWTRSLRAVHNTTNTA
jgi:hypothetical protein